MMIEVFGWGGRKRGGGSGMVWDDVGKETGKCRYDDEDDCRRNHDETWRIYVL